MQTLNMRTVLSPSFCLYNVLLGLLKIDECGILAYVVSNRSSLVNNCHSTDCLQFHVTTEVTYSPIQDF